MNTTRLVIGLTGGIGSGKTAASDYFATLNICIVDADIEARAVVKPGTDTLAKISEHFGPGSLNPDGSLNRSWLRERIFQHPEERRWLESVTHPAIRQRIINKLADSDSPYSILVSPLLFESRQNQLTDRVLLIDVPEALQMERTIIRDQSNSEGVKAILKAQMTRDERRKKADDIIVNDRDLAYLQSECLKAHQHYLKLAKQHAKTQV
ncbi:dephospho-CoA kinase [Oceanospirillum sp.]|uniref:dephospho-CoA kinase n=1 Tax=Oceanospirillum sp. TaxID=2021254 RepID=UPI003A95C9F3